MTIDTYAIRERVSRVYGWTQPAGAPEPVKQAAAEYQDAVRRLDDALVAYELEDSQRDSALKKHGAAVAEALREGRKPPAAKVPSLEELEVRHGAIIAARETFVKEAAAKADRVAAEHYPQWRATVVERLQAAADVVAQTAIANAQAVGDWGSEAQLLARLDRTWAPRGGKLDGASVIDLMENWRQVSGIESSQMGSAVTRHVHRLRQFTDDPVVSEYDPTSGPEQYSAAYLGQQSAATRELLRQQAEASAQGATPLPVPTEPSATAVFLPAS